MTSALFILALLLLWAKVMMFAVRTVSKPGPDCHLWGQHERGWSRVLIMKCTRCGVSTPKSEVGRLPERCDETARYLAVERVMRE